MLWGMATSVALAASSTLVLALQAAGATAALGVITALGLVRPNLDAAPYLAGPVSVLFVGLGLAGLHYADLGVVAALVVAAVPFTFVARRRLPFSKYGLQGLLFQGVLSFGVATLGMTIAALQGAPAAAAEDANGNDYGY
jgi:hypothetical protein